jgi:hypothetical protein
VRSHDSEALHPTNANAEGFRDGPRRTKSRGGGRAASPSIEPDSIDSSETWKEEQKRCVARVEEWCVSDIDYLTVPRYYNLYINCGR